MKTIKRICLVLTLLAQQLAAQDRMYLFDNTAKDVYIKEMSDYDVYFTLDTLEDAKVYMVSKRNIAILLKPNGERVFFKPKFKRQVSFELGILANNAFSGFPAFDLHSGDDHTTYRTLTRFSRVNGTFDPLPGAYLGYNFTAGKLKRLKYFISPVFSLVQNHFSYYQERHTNFGLNKEKKEMLISSVDVRALTLHLNLNIGCNINLSAALDLDAGLGLDLSFPIRNREEGYSVYYFTNDGVSVQNDTSYFNRLSYHSYADGGTPAMFFKISYKFKPYLGVFLAVNYNPRSDRTSNWMALGLKYYPFKKRR